MRNLSKVLPTEKVAAPECRAAETLAKKRFKEAIGRLAPATAQMLAGAARTVALCGGREL